MEYISQTTTWKFMLDVINPIQISIQLSKKILDKIIIKTVIEDKHVVKILVDYMNNIMCIQFKTEKMFDEICLQLTDIQMNQILDMVSALIQSMDDVAYEKHVEYVVY